MDVLAIAFYAFAILTVGSAIVMVFSKKIIHSAFALMFTLIGVAALYVLLYADFVAATQLLVYVGGILILILFGIMLTTQELTLRLKTVAVNIWPASFLMAMVAGILLLAFFSTEWKITEYSERDQTTYDLGMLLMQDYMLAFQMTGVLLLVAIIGAMLMATRNKGKKPSAEMLENNDDPARNSGEKPI